MKPETAKTPLYQPQVARLLRPLILIIFSDGTTAISPNVVAQIVAAVKASLATEKEQSLEQVSSPISCTHSSPVVLSNPASSYLTLGAVQPISKFALLPFWPVAAPCLWLLLLRVHLQVCNPLLVPSFVNTFSAPVSLTPATASLFRASPSVSTIFSSATPVVSPGLFSTSEVIPSLPMLHQPFVVSPGFSPVPAKTVSQIVSGKFVDLSD